jgi:putative Holliday junction resolvase
MPDVRPESIAGVVVGFDFGSKRIGVAVGQTVTRSAAALCTILMGRKHEPWKTISEILATWQPAAFVLGWPYAQDGEENPIQIEIAHFAAGLARRYRLPVFAFDETLSTADARERYFSGTHHRSASFAHQKDELAARLILQSWLEEPAASALPGSLR